MFRNSRSGPSCAESKLCPVSAMVPLGLVLLLPGALASCFGRDAHFKKLVAPVVQADRTDPAQVSVSWELAVERPQCVDRYYVRVWPEGTQMAGGERHLVTATTGTGKAAQVAMTKTVTIEPCVSYKYLVELEELDKVSGLDLERTAEATFASPGTASLRPGLSPIPASMVRATYQWDPVRQTVDLGRAVIRLDRAAVTHPSCLDHIQVTGAEVLPTRGPALARPPSGRGAAGRHLATGCQAESMEYQGGVGPQVVADLPSWAACSARCSATASCRAWIWRRPSARPGMARQCTLLQGHSGPPRPDAYTVSGPRGCSPARHGDPPPSSARAPLAGWLAPARPAFANLLPRTRQGPVRTVGPVKLAPPFLGETIDIPVPVQDCAGYMFHLQLHAGRKKLTDIPAVPLPALAALPGYVPPPVTSVLAVAISPAGVPEYKVLPSSGVTLGCLPAYFEAYDAYADRVEAEVGWIEGEERRVEELQAATPARLAASQQELLKGLGCSCSAPKVLLSTTDPAVLKKKQAAQLGNYTLGGMHGGHPFYTHTPPTQPALSSPTAAKPPSPTEPMFLYFYAAKKQWVFGDSLGSTSGLFFGTTEKSTAKCPGDSSTAGTWRTATGTFGRWKVNAKVTVTCGQ